MFIVAIEHSTGPVPSQFEVDTWSGDAIWYVYPVSDNT